MGRRKEKVLIITNNSDYLIEKLVFDEKFSKDLKIHDINPGDEVEVALRGIKKIRGIRVHFKRPFPQFPKKSVFDIEIDPRQFKGKFHIVIVNLEKARFSFTMDAQ